MESPGKHLVVTGSSAGGIEAISLLLGSLGRNFPAPIVVAQHLDPKVESKLLGILSKRTEMDVISVTDHEKMLPGTVYIVPANRNVQIDDGHVSVRSDGPPRPKPSVDLLFTTAARVYGDRLIAVVLSGMGSDGTAGARAVKSCGGTVVIEDPHTATFPSMPASLPAEMVDVVAPIGRIGAELEALFTEGPSLAKNPDELAELLDRIQAKSGIDFRQYKEPTIKRRLTRQIRSAGLHSLAEYAAYLERTPGEYDRLVDSFLINVTEFFRDPDLFAWLQRTAIPELVEAARGAGKKLRLWSAGCATGEEAYTLSILVAEVLGEELADFNVRIFATDIDDAAITVARRGIYPAAAFSTMAPELIERYFMASEGRYEVSKTIREMTVFGQHDLGQRAPFPYIDLVLCRNVLIYFSKELQQRTLQVFAFSIRNGGYLALGKAETATPLPENFEPVEPTLRAFRRYGERVSIPSASSVPLPQRLSPGDHARRRSLASGFERDSRRNENEEVGRFLMESAVGFVSLDARYDISTINAAARRMLSINGAAIGEDLVHLVAADSASRLRTIIDAALRTEDPQIGGEEFIVLGEDEQEARCLSISCYPKSTKGRGSAGTALLIVDVTELVRGRRLLESRAKEQAEETERLRAREVQWRQRRHDLLAANEQLVEMNAELRAQTDTLTISAEEATAATEEIETLNEEMQATNEELETLNEESQATIEELNTTNDELKARTTELQELLVGTEVQRREALDTKAALQAIVDVLAPPTAVVAPDGSISAANKAFRELPPVAGTAAVRLDESPAAGIAFDEVVRRAATGERFAFTYAPTEANRTVVFRGTVSPLADERPGGIIRLERTE